MEESTRLNDSTMHRRKRMISQSRPIYIDDESSTDSGCSSRGSSESNERLSRRGSADRLCDGSVVNSHGSCYLHRLREHQRHSSSTSQSQERLSSSVSCSNIRSSRSKSSRSWSPSEERGRSHHNHHHYHHYHHHHHHHHRRHSRESPSHSSSPSDAQSSDSDSLKRPSMTEVLRRTLQCLKIAKWQENADNHNSENDARDGNINNHNNNNSSKEKKQPKKSPRRILRDPVSYTYVKGLSGLPTQRVPRNLAKQVGGPCSCYDNVGLYR